MTPAAQTVEIKPKRIDIDVGRRNDITLEFILGNDKDEPIDIDADDVNFDIFDQVGGASILNKQSLAGFHFDGPNGTVVFGITDAEMAVAGASNTQKTFWHYTVVRTTGGGDTFTHICGAFTLEPCS